MWQTFGTSDLIHSSRMLIQSILLCGKHSTTFQIRIISRLWCCWRPGTLEVNIRRTSVHFRKSHVRIKKLDVQETDFCFTQFYRRWGDFSRCRFTHGWDFGLNLWVLVIEVFHSSPNQTNKIEDEREPRRNLSATPQSNMRKPTPTTNINPDLTNIDHVP